MGSDDGDGQGQARFLQLPGAGSGRSPDRRGMNKHETCGISVDSKQRTIGRHTSIHISSHPVCTLPGVRKYAAIALRLITKRHYPCMCVTEQSRRI